MAASSMLFISSTSMPGEAGREGGREERRKGEERWLLGNVCLLLASLSLFSIVIFYSAAGPKIGALVQEQLVVKILIDGRELSHQATEITHKVQQWTCDFC